MGEIHNVDMPTNFYDSLAKTMNPIVSAALQEDIQEDAEYWRLFWLNNPDQFKVKDQGTQAQIYNQNNLLFTYEL
jgi:hypothetical protein